MSDPRLELGTYVAIVACPQCGEIGTVPARITTRLVMTRDDGGSLGLKLKAGKLPHECGQLTISATISDLDRPEPEP